MLPVLQAIRQLCLPSPDRVRERGRALIRRENCIEEALFCEAIVCSHAAGLAKNAHTLCVYSYISNHVSDFRNRSE